MKNIVLIILVLLTGCISSDFSVNQVKLEKEKVFVSSQIPNFELKTAGIRYIGETKKIVNTPKRKYIESYHYFAGKNNTYYIRLQLSTIRFATWTEYQPWDKKTETRKFGKKYFESGLGNYNLPFTPEAIRLLKKHGINKSPVVCVSKVWVHVPPIKNKGTRITVRYFEQGANKPGKEFIQRADQRVKFSLF